MGGHHTEPWQLLLLQRAWTSKASFLRPSCTLQTSCSLDADTEHWGLHPVKGMVDFFETKQGYMSVHV